MSQKIFLVAAEASGDALGADLIDSLRRRDPTLNFAAIGGAAMARAGAPSLLDVAGLSVLGLIDGLKIYHLVVEKADAAAAVIIDAKPDIVVLIDAWGFTMRVARRLKKSAPKLTLVKYIGPQVWATRPGRAKTLAACVDHLICIQPFEPPFYAPYNLSCTVCGAPALGRTRKGDGPAFRALHKLDADQRLLLILPGSRQSEIRRMAPVLGRAAELLLRERPDVQPLVVTAAAVAPEVEAWAATLPFRPMMISEQEREDAFAAATVALAASGTVTTEIGLQGTPVVVGYRLGWLTWAVARAAFLWRAPYATLMNVAAGEEVAPEFLQTKFTAKRVANAAARLLDNPALRVAQTADQFKALDAMGRGGRPAAEIAADAIFAQLEALKP